MNDLLKSTVAAMFALSVAQTAIAQETQTPSEDNAEAAAESETTTGSASGGLELSMGEPELNVGDIYVASEHTDWQIRCVRGADGVDPCQLYQLLSDDGGNAVAEINLFPIQGQGQAVAGATVVTPLETLLTEQLSLSVDGGNARRYPFSWCTQIGCFSRIGLTAPEIQQFRAGNAAQITIVPVAAPDQKVRLRLSLSGFTAAWNALEEKIASANQ